MMKKSKKILSVISTTAIIVSALGGCGSEKSNSLSGVESATGDLAIVEKPQELTFFYPASKADDGQWEILNEAGKMTNVYAKVTLSKSNTDFEQAFNLMIASDNIPDIVESYNPMSLSQYGSEGAFVKLNEYLEEFAPNINKFLDENPEIKKRITAFDGNIYYIPHIPGGNVSTGWFIRQDWLDKLNLESPKNTDELYNVYKAFKENDPNGNGKADEIPYFSGTSGVDCLFTLWNARPDWYVEDGKVKYGPYEASYKEAIKNISKWYAEGLIDKEIFTRGNGARDKLFGNNIGGSTHDWFGSTAGYNNKLKDSVPGFNVKAIAPPSGIELERRPVSSPYGWAVSAGSENVETAVKYLDFWFTEEGRRLMNFGIEGTHYDLVDGKAVFKEELLKQDDFKSQLTQSGVQMDIGFRQDFEYEKQWLNETAVEGMELYEKGNYVADSFPMLSMEYSPEEMDSYSKYTTQIETYVEENRQKWILGANNIDSNYDEYMKTLKTLGMDKLIKLQQDAYDRYNKKN